MWNELLDIHKLAISTALLGKGDAILWLSSTQDRTREQAYNIIVGSLNEIEGMNEVPPTTIPGFFLEWGEIVTALGYVREQLRTWITMDPWFLLTLIRKGCQEYTYTLSWNEWVHEVKAEDQELSRYRDTVSALVRWIVSQVPHTTSEYHMLSAYIAHNIDSDPERTKIFLHEAIRLDSKNPENYLRLSAMFMNENDITNTLKVLRQGFNATGNGRIFETIIDLSSQYFGDAWAKILYHHYRPEMYIRPYSFARWIYRHWDPQDDLRFAILVGLETKNFSWKFSSYTKSALDVLDHQIEEALEGLNFQEWLDYADAEEKDQDELFEFLELCETEIFYLLDFRDLDIYLRIISKLSQSKKWQTLLGEYFEKYKLEGIMHEPENTLDMNVVNPEEGTPILQADVSGWWTLKESLAARLTFIMVHLHHHTPKVNEFAPKAPETNTDDTEVSTSLYDDENTDLWAIVGSHGWYSEEFWLIQSISHGYMGSVLLPALEHFDQKRHDEEVSMNHLWPRTSRNYYDIIDALDEEYGITVRRYLAHFARRDTFQGSVLPSICHEVSACMYFFIAERLIAWDHKFFQKKLPELLKKIDKRDVGMVITLSEILFTQTYYEEAIELICECPGALDDIDAQMIIIKSLIKYAWDDEQTDRLHQYVDDAVSGQSDFDSLYDVLYARYEELHGEVKEKVILSHLSQDDGDIIISEEDADDVETLGMLEYMLGALLPDDPEKRSAFLHSAMGHGSSEACLLQSLDDIEAGGDKENIFEGFVAQFPETQYPIRKEFFFWIVSLAIDTKQFQRAMDYIHIARVEGIDLFEYMPSDFWKNQEKRRVFYTMYIREGFRIMLWKDVPEVLLQGIQKDIQHVSLPFLTRISAAFVQTQLLPDKNLEYIPGYVRYWDYFVEQVLAQKDDPKILDACVDFVSDMYQDFDADEVPRTRLVWVTAIQFLASKIYAYIASSLKQKIQSWAPREVIREMMRLSEQFLEKTLYLTARISDFRAISTSEMIEDPSKDIYSSADIVYTLPKKEIPQTVFVPDFWHQKYLILQHQMLGLDNTPSSNALELPFTAIWGKPHVFPPYITLQ